VAVNGDASAVIDDLATPVGHQRDGDVGGMTGHRFIDRLVDNFVHEMVQARRARRADVHTWSLPDCFESFKDLNVFSAVLFGGLCHVAGFPSPMNG
jgi:hypothetical protein